MGFPTALLLANNGFKVKGFDINKDKLNLLKSKKLPFTEKGLDELFKKVDSFQIIDKLEKSDVFILTVPTPFTKDKKCDTSYIESACKNIRNVIDDNNLIVLESTVSPGTTEKIVKPIFDKTCKKYYLSYVSEKAIPGNTIYEMQHNHRIIGGINKKSAEKAKKIYSSFVKSEIHLTDLVTSEIVKLMENTYRDVNIALANEFLKISKEYKINVWEAIKLANLHPRVNIHNPGPGVGGHCIPIDPWFLLSDSNKNNLISLSRKINDSMPKYVLMTVKKILGQIKNPVITVFGVSYKGNIDDYRKTPTLKFIKNAEKEGFKIKIFDPLVKNFQYNIISFEDSLKNSDCIIVFTDHDFFKDIKPEKISISMRNKNIFDTRNIINFEKWKNAGFNVYLLGGRSY